MSNTFTRDDVLFRQRILSCSGLYTDALDGLWGRHTDEADRRFHDGCERIAKREGSFDSRSERNIRSLRLDAQERCRASLAAIRAGGLDARVISGVRSYAEQAALYRQGRNGNRLPKVTNAKAGQSWHNFGLAWDIGLFRRGEYLTDGAEYDRAGALGKVDAVEWGGDWRSFKDRPHFQAPFGAGSITEARTLFERGGRPR